MKAHPYLLFLSLWLIAAGLEAQSVVPWKYYPMLNWDTSPYKPYRFTSAYSSKNMNFRLLFPTNYDSTATGDNYPIILVLHGAGESALRDWSNGNNLYPAGDPRIENNDHQLLWGGKEHLNAVNNGKFNGFVLFPQNWHGTWIDSKGEATSNYYIDLQNAVEITEYLVTKLRIDPNRIYVWGLSNGGAASWYVAYKRPDLFAGSLPMSAPGDPAMASVLVEQPIWVFQGETDTNPRPMFTKETISAIEKAGGLPRYTEYAGTGHNTWTKAYNEADFFSWMLSQNKLKIHAYYGKTEFPSSSAFTTTLGISQGFNGYEWRHNGSTIHRATTHSITISQYGDYQVRVKRGSTWSEWSPIKKITTDGTLTAPAAPSNLLASATSSSSINLSWTDNATNEDNFRIFRSASSTGTYSLIATLGANTTSFTNTGLNSGTQYFYQVEAVNAAGSSARSNTASATTEQTHTEVFSAPSGLTAQWASGNKVNLSWKDNTGDEEGFILERASKPDFAGKIEYIGITKNQITYTDQIQNTKKGGGTLYYRIKAIKGSISSDYSNTASPNTTSTSSTARVMTIRELELQESFMVYPNPFSDHATIQFVLQNGGNYSLSLYDSKGILVSLLEQGLAEAGEQQIYELDGTQLVKGLYLVLLQSNEGKQTLKLLYNK